LARSSQPIVDLESGAILAYEALTRFADGTGPEVVFAEAARAGMSVALESATARSALEAAAPLPANRPIHLNVSPEVILAGEPLGGILREWGFGVILEVTEHSPITDYAAVRAAVADLGADVRLAIDDAGAGFASLRHILELRPSVVKLDLSLIRGVDADPARQALVAGMVHFAARLEFALVAEGVETRAEQATLLALGIRRAQGYLLGGPAPAEELRVGAA
jgi:EAL domain-containing protein (putative c-di-GMP-specific phosphodiesterase class I)